MTHTRDTYQDWLTRQQDNLKEQWMESQRRVRAPHHRALEDTRQRNAHHTASRWPKADWSAASVVPGSHRLMDNPWELYGTSFRSSLTLDAELPQEAMPNHCECIEATAAVCAF